jgi:hypothetical protein
VLVDGVKVVGGEPPRQHFNLSSREEVHIDVFAIFGVQRSYFGHTGWTLNKEEEFNVKLICGSSYFAQQ